MRRGITRHMPGMHRHAAPGESLHVGHRRVVVRPRAMVHLLLQNGVAPDGGSLAAFSGRHGRGSPQLAVLEYERFLGRETDDDEHTLARRRLGCRLERLFGREHVGAPQCQLGLGRGRCCYWAARRQARHRRDWLEGLRGRMRAEPIRRRRRQARESGGGARDRLQHRHLGARHSSWASVRRRRGSKRWRGRRSVGAGRARAAEPPARDAARHPQG